MKRRVIDRRNKEKFQIDDAYINGHARVCGIYATGVYDVLCRHADREQYCFPSVKLIAEKLGISRDSAMKGIKSLEEWNIVKTERIRTKKGTWLNNSYILLDKSEWKSCQVAHSNMDNQVGVSNTPSRSQQPNQVGVSDFKDTHREGHTYKDTHTAKDKPLRNKKPSFNPLGAEIIKSFEEVNPACKRFYGNTTQRQACDDLIASYGLQKSLQVVRDLLPKTNGLQYFPTITTPVQLRDKWAALEAATKRKQSELQDKPKVFFS